MSINTPTAEIIRNSNVAKELSANGYSDKLKGLFKRFGGAFWRYTEETGKADTSPYDGLL
ncbi:MAG: hypothetical protein AB3N20_08200 [Rhizobiaceae bacterium]